MSQTAGIIPVLYIINPAVLYFRFSMLYFLICIFRVDHSARIIFLFLFSSNPFYVFGLLQPGCILINTERYFVQTGILYVVLYSLCDQIPTAYQPTRTAYREAATDRLQGEGVTRTHGQRHRKQPNTGNAEPGYTSLCVLLLIVCSSLCVLLLCQCVTGLLCFTS